jgi:hypothetical protein
MIVSDIIDDVIDILGRGTKTDAYKRLAEAVTVLSRKGRWNPLIRYVDIKAGIDGTTLTLPREVETVLAVNWNCQPLLGRSEWFQFHLNGGGQFNTGGWNWDNRGDFPTYQDILNPAYLTAICRLKSDLDTRLLVLGYNELDEVLRYQDADGVWHDGLPVDMHLTTDFPYGIPYVESTRSFFRNFTTVKPSQLTSVSAHELTEGEQVTISAITGTVPSPLTVGTSYFVGKDSDTLISLYTTREGSLSDTGKVIITDTPSSTISLKDSRIVSVQTKFTSATAHNISNGTRVEITADVIPAPFVANTTYYASKIDNNNVALHSNLSDAESNLDPIDCTDVGNLVVLNAKQTIYPSSFLSFSVNHNYVTGDAVTVSNPSGELPSPLLPNTTYYVRYLTTKRISIHNNQFDAINNENIIVLTTKGTGSSSIVKAIPSGITVGSAQQITAPSHGLNAGDFVQFLTSGTFPSTEIPPASGTFGTITQGTVYKVASPLSADTFTIKNTSDQAIDILNTGNGQIQSIIQRTFFIGFTGEWETDATNLATNQAIQLDSEGTFPTTNPVVTTATDYYIKKISDKKIELYTNTANTTKVPVATASRYRTGNEVFVTTASVHGFTTGDKVDVEGIGGTLDGVCSTVSLGGTGTGYIAGQVGLFANAAGNQCQIKLDTVSSGDPTVVSVVAGGEGFAIGNALTYVSGFSAGTSKTFTVATVTNGVNNVSNVYSQDSVAITVTSTTQFKFTGSGLNSVTPVLEPAGTVSPSPIRVVSLGDSDLDIVLKKSVTVTPYDNTLKTDDTTYIQDGMLVKLTTTGALPLPFATGTNYKIYVDSTGFFRFKTTSDIDVALLSIGSGVHTVNIDRNFTLVPMTDLAVPNHLFNNGDAVTAQEVGVLPTPFVDETIYYVRSTGDDTIALYDTSAHAIATGSTTGRIAPTTSGTGVNQIYQIVSNTKVSRVIQVIKDESDGYIDLLAMDDGRSTDLTQIGTYHPDETRPAYRRIIVPECNGTARVRFQVRTFNIKSDDDYIPLESSVALICMLRSMELFRTGNFEEAKKYEAQALSFLREEKSSMDGGANTFIQFNKNVFNRSQDVMQ